MLQAEPLQEHPIISIQSLCQFLGVFLTDGTAAIFHIGDVATGDTGKLCKLILGEAFPNTVCSYSYLLFFPHKLWEGVTIIDGVLNVGKSQ